MILTGGVQSYEAYLSAQPPSPFQGSRFPQENGYFQRPQGSCPPPCQGPQGPVCLSATSAAESQHSDRFWRNGSPCGAIHSPRSLFIWGQCQKMSYPPLPDLFPPLGAAPSLKYTKYVCRCYSLICKRIPRRNRNKPSHSTVLD